MFFQRIAQSVVVFAGVLAFAATAAPLLAQSETLPRVGPELGAASNLSQGQQAGFFITARQLGVTNLRDGMNWGRVERHVGSYDFNDPRTTYPQTVDASGMGLTVVLNWGNPLYDNGATPMSEAALMALSDYVTRLLETYPFIESIEVGNEFNGTNFVRGPIAEMSPLERAEAYVPFLEAITVAAKRVDPDIRISGGATHSIAAGYLWRILDAGGADFLDTLAIHPYTTDAEQLARQIKVLRRHPAASDLPIEMTEFGTQDPAGAASHFVRNYCQMALSGVSRAVWYPAASRDDGLVGLFDPDGRVTGAGKAFRLIAAHMEGRPVIDLGEDSFTYGCQFGDSTLALWGVPREVRLAAGIRALDAEGHSVNGPVMLSETEPLVIIMDSAKPLAEALSLGSHDVVADTYHQFAFPLAQEAHAEGDGFARFARRGDKDLPLTTMPGQQDRGVPWFPYRGNPDYARLRLTSDLLIPAGHPKQPIEIVHQFVAKHAQSVDIHLKLSVSDRSEDGVMLVALINDELLREYELVPGGTLEDVQTSVDLEPGDVLEISVGPNRSSVGDVTQYRFTLRDADA